MSFLTIISCSGSGENTIGEIEIRSYFHDEENRTITENNPIFSLNMKNQTFEVEKITSLSAFINNKLVFGDIYETENSWIYAIATTDEILTETGEIENSVTPYTFYMTKKLKKMCSCYRKRRVYQYGLGNKRKYSD